MRVAIVATTSLLLLRRNAQALVPRSAFLNSLRNTTGARRGIMSSSSSPEKKAKTSSIVANAVAEPFVLPQARTGTPGVKEVEDQPVRNPISSSSSVLVVGGTRGIGLEFVRQCAAKGASVVATHRGEEVPDGLADLIEKSGGDELKGKVIGLRMDVSDETSIKSAADELRNKEGFQSLTHVIHSAGAYLKGTSFDGKARGPRDVTPPVTKEIMMNTFLINTVGPLMVAQSFVPLMGQAEGVDKKNLPILAFLTSKVGSVYDNGSGGTYAYRASKSALNNVCKSLSVDLAGECSVVLLHPGYVRTDMTGGNGLIDVDESVSGMIGAIESTDATVGFRWVDYKAELIPW